MYLVAEALARRQPVHDRLRRRLLAAEECLERLVVGQRLARRLVIGVGQVGDDHLAPLALRLQLQRQFAEVVLVVAAVGLVGRLAAAAPQPERPVGGLWDGEGEG